MGIGRHVRLDKRAALGLAGASLLILVWIFGGGSGKLRAGSFAAVQDNTSIRTGYDPLSPEEEARALNLARSNPGVAGLLRPGQRAEVLFVERFQEDKAVTRGGTWPRRAVVYIYDYAQDVVAQAVVNLQTGATELGRPVRGAQLPPSRAEADRALQFILADGRAGAELRRRYQEVTGSQLTQADQIRVQSGIFHAASEPDHARGPAAACGAQRCVELLLTTADGQMLGTQLVNLSSQELIQLSR